MISHSWFAFVIKYLMPTLVADVGILLSHTRPTYALSLVVIQKLFRKTLLCQLERKHQFPKILPHDAYV